MSNPIGDIAEDLMDMASTLKHAEVFNLTGAKRTKLDFIVNLKPGHSPEAAAARLVDLILSRWVHGGGAETARMMIRGDLVRIIAKHYGRIVSPTRFRIIADNIISITAL